MKTNYDAAVIGAGVFGVWTAYALARQGRRVVLLDAHGAGNSRSSSGGETRIIRMNYGADELYTRLSQKSLRQWLRFCGETHLPLFHRTGALFTAPKGHPHLKAAAEVLSSCGVRHEVLGVRDLKSRFPQIQFDTVTALYEPHSGVLMARRAVMALLEECERLGVRYLTDAATWDKGLRTASGRKIAAAQYVFACGPWLPRLFPEILDGRIRATRQQVFFLGAPPGDERFAPPSMPVWIDFEEGAYTVPDIECRGFKIGVDRHGPEMDPETLERVPTADKIAEMRRVVARRFPGLRNAPLVEARVCQYENTWNGDFLVDRHPEFANVWLVGGGSGHGFKHGPAIGAHVAGLLNGGDVLPRFSLATKKTRRQRQVF